MQLKTHKKKIEAKDYIDLLPTLEGKLILYMGNTERVLHHEFKDGILFLKTDKRARDISMDKIAAFIADIELIKEANTSIVKTESPEIIQSNVDPHLFSKLTEMMLENIDKVKTDPNYTRQAQSINNSVKQITEMVKTQLDYARLQRKLKE